MSQGAGMNYRALVGNAAIAFAAQGVSLAVSVTMSLLVPKVLGVATYGYWQLFVFYAGYSGFFHLGLNDGVYLVEGGKTRNEIDKKLINSQFRVALALQLVVGLAISLIGVFVADSSQRGFVMVAFALYTVMLNLSAYFGYVFQAMNETKLFSFMTVLERLAFLVPLLVMVMLKVGSFEPFVIAYLLARACSLIYSFWKARDFLSEGGLSVSESIKAAVASIKVGFSLMAANIASMLILGVARAVVDAAWGIEVFGRVSFSLSMVNFFITFVVQASMVLFPALRQGTAAERKSFYRGVRDMMEVVFPFIYLLYFPMVWALSLWLPQYADSMGYFALLLPVCVFDTKMDICCSTYFKVLRKERTLLKVNVATVVASTILSMMGAFLLESVEAVLVGAVSAIVGRSLWSEHRLNKLMGISGSAVPAEEVLLTISFVILALNEPVWAAVVTYAVLYVVYLIVNRQVARALFQSMVRVFRH